MWIKNWLELLFPVNIINEILVIFWIDLIMKFPHCEKQNANCILVSLCVYNNCKDNKLLVLAWNKLIWLIQKNDKIAILSLQFMPLLGNKSSGAIFGTFVRRFHISPALSEKNVPLLTWHHSVLWQI